MYEGTLNEEIERRERAWAKDIREAAAEILELNRKGDWLLDSEIVELLEKIDEGPNMSFTSKRAA